MTFGDGAERNCSERSQRLHVTFLDLELKKTCVKGYVEVPKCIETIEYKWFNHVKYALLDSGIG